VIDNATESDYLPAALEALKAFPIQLENISAIKHSENVTFRVTPRGSKTHYALRLHRPGYNSLAELNSERQWTRALKEAGLAVPESFNTIEGHHFHPVNIHATGEQRLAGLTTWLEGIPLDEYLPECTDLEERQEIYRQIGVLAAKSHNQATNWNEPPDFQRRRLDADGLVGADPHWGRFWEHAELTEAEGKLLRRARQHAHSDLVRLGKDPQTFSLIHADLNPDNIVHANGKLAMIDFDDAAYGWHMYDIASALFEERHHPDFENLRTAFFAGYQQHRQIGEREIGKLDLFFLIRGLAVIGWFHQRPEHAESEYFEGLKDSVCAECERLF
jgi:Ser/Thr protein kinase RdoA (MazF antagonist)